MTPAQFCEEKEDEGCEDSTLGSQQFPHYPQRRRDES